VGILQDLQGPRIRTGRLKDKAPVQLKRGESLVITCTDFAGVPGRISTTYGRLAKDVSKGTHILLADGTMELIVEKVSGRDVYCRVLRGGSLGEHKGINLPGVSVSAPPLTAKDRADLALGLALGVDMVALSFVRRAEDIKVLRRAIGGVKHPPLVIAKIEHPDGVANIDGILQQADGIMVARGDLGIEMSLARVPIIQKELIDSANRAAKPVITATQMLESMIGSPRPTRAEATDVANAVFDGADAVMLSGETAVGQFPIETVKTMSDIVRCAEDRLDRFDVEKCQRLAFHTTDNIPRAVCDAAARAAQELSARGVAVLTRSGATARLMAWHRLKMPIIALTPSDAVARRLAVVWGVEAMVMEEAGTTDQLVRRAEALLKKRFAGNGKHPIVMVGGTTTLAGATNVVRVVRLS
jgi:pyruvate kinase